jgi:hypothetical protein
VESTNAGGLRGTGKRGHMKTMGNTTSGGTPAIVVAVTRQSIEFF